MSDARTKEDQRVRLLEALLNTPDLQRRYTKQADFYHAINLMVGALPQHVEAMAKSSDDAEALHKRMVDEISRGAANMDWKR